MWKHFTLEEFKCKHCDRNLIEKDFVDKLDALRETLGRPLRVTSGYRCPDHNQKVSTTGRDGPHTTGRAVDLAVDGVTAFKLVQLAIQAGFTGIGVQQKGINRFIHLDDLPATDRRPRPTIWSY